MEPMQDINDEDSVSYRFFDILSDELALHIFKYLDLHSLFVCLGVNQNFRRLICDPSVGVVSAPVIAMYIAFINSSLISVSKNICKITSSISEPEPFSK